MLRAWLDWHRSTLSLLGLVRHLSEVFVTLEVAAARVVEAAAETLDVTGLRVCPHGRTGRGEPAARHTGSERTPSGSFACWGERQACVAPRP